MCNTEIRATKALRNTFTAAGHHAKGWWTLPMVSLRTDKGNAEIDLLVGVPSAGLLIIEIKGWRDFQVNENGYWFQRRDATHPWVEVGRGPYAQSERQEYILLHQLLMLRQQGLIAAGNLPKVGSCVLFGNHDSGIDLPKHLETVTLFKDTFCPKANLNEMEAKEVLGRLVSILRSQAGESREFDNRLERVDEVRTVFTPVSSVRGLGAFVRESVARIEQLSQTAFSERTAAFEGERLVVEGAAGTGKTVYALQLAISHARDAKTPSLYVCFSERLAQHIRGSEILKGRNVSVATPEELLVQLAGADSLKEFLHQDSEQHRTLGQIAHALGSEFPEVGRRFYISNPDFVERIVNVAAEINTNYSAVVIDEAQDFSESFIDSLSLLVAPRGLFAVFYDPLQTTRRERTGIGWSTPMSLREAKKQVLVRNYRNGDQIIDFVEKEFSEIHYERPEFGAPESIVETREYSDPTELPVVTKNLLTELGENDIAPSVLVSSVGANDLLALREVGIEPILVDDFKGLESQAVVLVIGPTRNPLDPNREDLYVGLTRANGYLGLVRRTKKPAHQSKGL